MEYSGNFLTRRNLTALLENSRLNRYFFRILTEGVCLFRFQFLRELVRCKFDFSEYFSNQWAGEISTRVSGQGRCPAVRVSVKNMAPFLSNNLKAQAQKRLLHSFEVDNRQPRHTATSICWSPTNRGRSSASFPNSSIHSSRTSFMFFWSSSRVAAWLCAPGIPGTIPT